VSGASGFSDLQRPVVRAESLDELGLYVALDENSRSGETDLATVAEYPHGYVRYSLIDMTAPRIHVAPGMDSSIRVHPTVQSSLNSGVRRRSPDAVD
jgi:hypothetical protein